MAAIVTFHGGPLDGVAEPLRVCPVELVFSSAAIGDWETGAPVVCDVVYRRDDPPAFEAGCWLPLIAYRCAT